MLSIFPDLLVYTLVAPLILRLASGILLFVWGVRSFGSEKHTLSARLSEWRLPAKQSVLTLGIVEIVAGICLIAGAWTQLSALVALIISGTLAYLSHKEPLGSTTTTVYMLVAIISLSLLFTGAGFFAFDLPL